MNKLNGDPDIIRILDIIDEKHSRYLVAQAVGGWVKTERLRAVMDELRLLILADDAMPDKSNMRGLLETRIAEWRKRQ